MKKKSEKALLTIAVEKQLREEFKKVCKENDLDASKVLRHFMRQYIERNKNE